MGFPDRNLCLNGIKAVVQINKSQEIQCYPLSRLLYHFFQCAVCLWAAPPPNRFEFPGFGNSNPRVTLNYRTLGLPVNGNIRPEDTCLLAKAFRRNHCKAGNHELGAVSSLEFMGSCHPATQKGCWSRWVSDTGEL